MPSKTPNRNVRSADVVDTADETGGRSLRRGLHVLDAILRGGREGVRVIDLCRRCGLERAPVYRLLATLIDTGYVARRGRFRYVPGRRSADLSATSDESDLVAQLQPVLARIGASCGDAAFAIVREGPLSRCIARQVGSYPVQILSVQVGTRQPLGVGAAGLALLAALPADEASALIATNAQALAAYGGMTPSRLDLLVSAARERGWSVVGNHAVKGGMGVGMAVLDAGGRPLAGLSVAAAMGRMPKQRQQLIAGMMREAVLALLPDGVSTQPATAFER
ncbi:MAG: IclR family transcriptional regulator [Janthinobacterium lividum]